MSGLFDLSGRVALVTGGNGGLGLGMATGLARCGASVAIAGRDMAKAEAAREVLLSAGAPRVELVAADVTDEAAVSAMVEETVSRLGRLDVLVNNAGTSVRKAPTDLTPAEWHHVLDTNLTSAFLASRAAHPHLAASGRGRVINNGSMLSLFGMPFAAAYGASKGGVVQLTKSLAAAWAPDGITVNCVLPGWIDTALTRGAREQVPGLHERVLARTPLARWGAVSDFEGIAAFLASDAAAFVTGAAVPVDGGYSAAG